MYGSPATACRDSAEPRAKANGVREMYFPFVIDSLHASVFEAGEK